MISSVLDDQTLVELVFDPTAKTMT